MTVSKSRIDKVGGSLRDGTYDAADLKILKEYRNSFGEVYIKVTQLIQDQLRSEHSGRRIKSMKSIMAKLVRDTVKLSQIHDIVGCRMVIPDIPEQDEMVLRLGKLFQDVKIIDRRVKPSHGYRAVHVIVSVNGKCIEVQVRTELQHIWAQGVEDLFDTRGSDIKYGKGPEHVQKALLQASDLVSAYEESPRKSIPPVRRKKGVKERLALIFRGLYSEAAMKEVREQPETFPKKPRESAAQAGRSQGGHGKGRKLFMIQFHRPTQQCVVFKEFDLSEAEQAYEETFALEEKMWGKSFDEWDEVVLLEAESAEALKRTHSRYWGSGIERMKEARKRAS